MTTMGKPLRNVWGETLVELGTEDDRVVVMDGDLANSTRADRAMEQHAWSVDFARDTDGKWWVIDMALASHSWWPEGVDAR